MTTPPPKQPVTGWQRDLVIRINRGIYRFSVHWLAIFNLLIGIYVGLPILAPILMNAGATGPATLIYTLYKPMCHQMASRSFFLFGEQPAYPRTLAGTDLTPIDAYLPTLPEFAEVTPGNWAQFQLAARAFLGNEQMGYKMALCERDMGIYAFVLIGGLLYGLLRRRVAVPPLPIWAFVLFGLLPISLDGFSQLFGYFSTPIDGSAPTGIMAALQSIFPLRESSPLLRTLTGALFGLMLAWLAYPRIDDGMGANAAELKQKLTRIGEL
ncbi:MAG: DUF2085 domain-containing protein [Anaerolineales bacterium]|nr:DUF2085 domain-containing protein [Anaerolineales bacterium]